MLKHSIIPAVVLGVGFHQGHGFKNSYNDYVLTRSTLLSTSPVYTSADSLNPKEMNELAMCAQHAYAVCDDESTQAIAFKNLTDKGWKTQVFQGSTGVRGVTQNMGFIAYHPTDNRFIVSFHGTKPNIDDIITDLDLRMTNSPSGGSVHNGFEKALMTSYDQIKDLMRSMAGDNLLSSEIYGVGHSMGAALALGFIKKIVADTDMVGTYYDPSTNRLKVVTLGAPRSQDAHGAHDCNVRVGKNNIIQFVSSIDTVVHGIMGSITGYKHAGLKVYLSEDTFVPGHAFSGLSAMAAPFVGFGPFVAVIGTTNLWGTGNNHPSGAYTQNIEEAFESFQKNKGNPSSQTGYMHTLFGKRYDRFIQAGGVAGYMKKAAVSIQTGTHKAYVAVKEQTQSLVKDAFSFVKRLFSSVR